MRITLKTLILLVKGIALICLFSQPASADWVRTNGPYGGNISSLAVNGNNLFAATYDAGVFISTDNGTNWTSVDSGLTRTRVSSLATRGDTIFAGTNEGVFLSTNNGASWTAVNSGVPAGTAVYALTVNDKDIFAGTYLCAFFPQTKRSIECHRYC